MKNKTAPPQRVAYFDFYFAEGGPCLPGEYDFAKEIAALAVVKGIIDRKGGWYYYGERKWQGIEPVIDSIRGEIDLKEELQKLYLVPPMYRWLEILTMIENKKFIVNDQAWAHELEKGVENYTDMLFEAIWEGGDDEITETLSGEAFCGCSPCFWRKHFSILFLVCWRATRMAR